MPGHMGSFFKANLGFKHRAGLDRLWEFCLKNESVPVNTFRPPQKDFFLNKADSVLLGLGDMAKQIM